MCVINVNAFLVLLFIVVYLVVSILDQFSSMRDWAPAWRSASEEVKAKFKEQAKEKPQITTESERKKKIQKLLQIINHNVIITHDMFVCLHMLLK